MRPLMPPIQTPDNLFHDGNPLTGVLGTIVPSEHLNNEQSSIRDVQSELIAILTAAAMVPESSAGQLLAALNKLYAPGSDSLGALSSLVGAANNLPYFTGPKGAALTTLTSAARDFISCLGVNEMRNYLQLGALSSLVGAANKLPYFNGPNTAALTTLTSAARDFISCLGVPEMRNYLNLGMAALKDVGTGTGQVPDMSSWTSGSGWIKFPDGTIIQSGSQVVAGSTTISSSPLPIPFTSTNYSLIASFSGSAAFPSGPCGGRPNSVSDFVLVNWSSTQATLNWLAMGK